MAFEQLAALECPRERERERDLEGCGGDAADSLPF